MHVMLFLVASINLNVLSSESVLSSVDSTSECMLSSVDSTNDDLSSEM